MKRKILQKNRLLNYIRKILKTQTFLIADRAIPPYVESEYMHTNTIYDEKGILKTLKSSQILKYPIKTSNKPLVIFVGGACDDIFKTVLNGLYHKYYTENSRIQDIGYTTWSSKALIPIINSWHKIDQKICLVGHSWGGDTVYKMANILKDIKIDMLCTIDPVSFKGSGGNLKKPNNVRIWLNAAINYSKAVLSLENTIAIIGRPWGFCKYANKNFISHQININGNLTNANHAMAKELFYNHLYKYVKNFPFT